MIANLSCIPEENQYECNVHVMRYLVYNCKIPILGVHGKKYRFMKTRYLEKCLARMPLLVKIKSIF